MSNHPNWPAPAGMAPRIGGTFGHYVRLEDGAVAIRRPLQVAEGEDAVKVLASINPTDEA